MGALPRISLPFRRRKYVLYCKPDPNEKHWEPVAELEHKITLTEAKALYGDDCFQLRLEEVDAETGKRIRIVWVEPKRKKKERVPTLGDIIAEGRLLLGALAELHALFEELPNLVGRKREESPAETLKYLAELVRGGVELARIMQQNPEIKQSLKQLLSSGIGGLAMSPSTVVTPSQPKQEIPEHLEEHLMYSIEKDLKDIEEAPCAKQGDGLCIDSGE